MILAKKQKNKKKICIIRKRMIHAYFYYEYIVLYEYMDFNNIHTTHNTHIQLVFSFSTNPPRIYLPKTHVLDLVSRQLHIPGRLHPIFSIRNLCECALKLTARVAHCCLIISGNGIDT